MSQSADRHDAQRTTHARKSPPTAPSSQGLPSSFIPTTFFLRSERDIEQDVHRGRRSSNSSATSSNGKSSQFHLRSIKESSFGVQSLEDTIASAFECDAVEELLRPKSEHISHPHTKKRPPRRSDGAGASKISVASHISIPSVDWNSAQSSSMNSPRSIRSCVSPVRTRGRRVSNTSTANVSHPLTPLRMSPHAGSAAAGTSRSASPKSFRLSDDETSVMDDVSSQAIQSDGEDDVHEDKDQEHEYIHNGIAHMNQSSVLQPQFVMPSLALPSRRPFTERGQRIDKLRLLVVGRSGCGRTSLIQSLLRICEDIVHADAPVKAASRMGKFHGNGFVETFASTKPKPRWWTEPSSHAISSRRKSFSGGSLERNLHFLDGPAIDALGSIDAIRAFLRDALETATTFNRLTDGDMLRMLGGNGSPLIDGVLWLFTPDASKEGEASLTTSEKELLQMCCKTCNVIPLIGHSDCLTSTEIEEEKSRVRNILVECGASTYSFTEPEDRPQGTDEARPLEPFAVSSALSDDLETIDASVLMSSQYVQPLIHSDFRYFVERLFDPENIARMRHLAAVKMLEWRWQQSETALISMQAPTSRSRSLPGSTTHTSGNDEDDKVMVPYGGFQRHRSTSPSTSEVSILSARGPPSSTYTPYALSDNRNMSPEPFRRVRLAKWAQDLQRSLENERQRYKRMYNDIPSEWRVEDGEKSQDQALIINNDAGRPQQGRLGGAVAVIDPSDPLGILAWTQAVSKRSRLVFQLAGSFGIVGMVALWAVRNWSEVQEFLGQSPMMIHASAIPAPSKHSAEWMDGASWRNFLGWSR